MVIKQISVFVENRPGRLAEITSVIAKSKVDIRALSIADTSHFGILRLIVNDSDKAQKALKKAGLTLSITNVVAFNIADVPGGLANALSILAQKEIPVEYIYAFVAKNDLAFAVLRTDDIEGAVDALKIAGYKSFSIEDV